MGADYRSMTERLREDRRALLGRWVDTYRSSRYRLPREVDSVALSRLVEPILENLAEALSPGRGGQPALAHLSPGAAELRELEKSVAFVGASMGGEGFSAYDAAALVWSLRDTLRVEVDADTAVHLCAYLDWLLVVAMESVSSARESALVENQHEELDEGTPIVLITEELPAMLLVGRPDDKVLQSLFARLLLQIVRVGARAAIIDVTGLARPIVPQFFGELAKLRQHRKVDGTVSLYGVGVPDDERGLWGDQGGAAVELCDSFDRAVAEGLARAGRRLVASGL